MGLNLSHTNAYVPTPCEVKLLEALSNPENRKKNITELCEVAGVSRFTYYQSFRKPDFVTMYNEHLSTMIKESLNDVIKATIDFAKNDPRAHADRKILLEMGKLYSQRQEIDHNIKSVFFSSEDDIKD